MTIRVLLTMLAAVALSLPSVAQDAETPVGPPGTSDRTIEKTTIVAAPVEKVWWAWTTADGIKSFLAPDAKIELRVGGAYEIYFVPSAPEGSRGSEGCQVLAYLPREMLAFSWSAPPSMPAVRKMFTQVVVAFEPLDADRTRVRLVHHGWGSGPKWDQAYAYFDKAWAGVLGALSQHFATQEKDGVDKRDAADDETEGEAMARPAARQQFVYFIEPVRPTFLKDATEAEQQKVSEHFRYLQLLLADGTLILAGRSQEDPPVGIVIFEARDADTARQIFEGDPAVAAGVFKGRVAPYGVALMRKE
jgi:uncharacterized protein YndB with AHSA1/START domain/uncharacterized protein YciI